MEAIDKRIKNQRNSDFFRKLSPALMDDWNAMEFPHSYGPNVVLFAEKEAARGIFVVLEGEVRLSINSTDGKRLSLRRDFSFARTAIGDDMRAA